MRLLKVLAISLMGLSLPNCKSFPILHPYVLSLKNGVCGEYVAVKQTNACDIEYQFVKWHPLTDCEGYFMLPPSDIAALKEYQAAQCANSGN